MVVQTSDAVTTRRGGAQAAKSASSSNEKRTTNTTACLPVVFGSIAFYLGKKADEFQTHEWTLYVRGPNHEDLSCCISKVVFQLHASFSEPTREVSVPPYQVTERGWGEFEAQIRIIWKDPTEKATVVNHSLRLYPPGAPRNTLPTGDNVEPVVAESFDEIVFTNPTETFFRQLKQIKSLSKMDMANQEHMDRFTDEDTFMAMVQAQRYLEEQLSQAKERFVQLSSELEQTDARLIAAQEAHAIKQQQQASAKARAPPKRSRPSQSKKAKAAAAASSTVAAVAAAPASASKARTTAPPATAAAPAQT